MLPAASPFGTNNTRGDAATQCLPDKARGIHTAPWQRSHPREPVWTGVGAMRASDGDRRAFEAEMLPHLDAAYRLAYALSGRRQDAEDLVQDAYLRAFAAYRRFERGSNARAWLLTILRHVYLNDLRRARARPFVVAMGESSTLPEFVDTRSPSPEEETLRAEGERLLLAALAELPETFRSVVALVDLDGLHYAEAAAVLGCPVGTVMSRLYRARHELARRLRPAGAGARGSS
jgi:RNA polymerase sigma-70 factor (ECF subfamily)